jgi:hypothetical protein
MIRTLWELIESSPWILVPAVLWGLITEPFTRYDR